MNAITFNPLSITLSIADRGPRHKSRHHKPHEHHAVFAWL